MKGIYWAARATVAFVLGQAFALVAGGTKQIKKIEDGVPHVAHP